MIKNQEHTLGVRIVRAAFYPFVALHEWCAQPADEVHHQHGIDLSTGATVVTLAFYGAWGATLFSGEFVYVPVAAIASIAFVTYPSLMRQLFAFRTS